MSSGSKRGGSQNKRAISATVCLVLRVMAKHRGEWSPPGLAQCRPYHAKLFLGRSRVSGAQASAHIDQGLVSGFFFWGGVHYLFMTNFASVMLSSQKFFETMPLALASRRMESSDSPILRIALQIA